MRKKYDNLTAFVMNPNVLYYRLMRYVYRMEQFCERFSPSTMESIISDHKQSLVKIL